MQIHQLPPPVLAEHRELAGDAHAFGREAHGGLALLIGGLLDEAGGLDLLEDGVKLSVAVHGWQGSWGGFARAYAGVDPRHSPFIVPAR